MGGSAASPQLTCQHARWKAVDTTLAKCHSRLTIALTSQWPVAPSCRGARLTLPRVEAARHASEFHVRRALGHGSQ